MKKICSLLLLLIIFTACNSNKPLLERTDIDKALQDAVKKLNKNATDPSATEALPVLYNSIKERRLDNIKSYSASDELNKWDKLINEYQALQNAYDAIVSSLPAFKLVTPQSYSAKLLETREAAAADYYNYAQTYFIKPGRDNAKKAYLNFKKTDKYIPGYKDSNAKMQQACQNATIIVVINPVQDNSFFFNNGWGSYGTNYSNEYFQQTLLRDLNNNNFQYPAKFYNDWEAKRDRIQPDWVVDLRLRNLDVPFPINNFNTRRVSNQIPNGTDSSGRPIYTTVFATINITQSSFTARAELELNIRDIDPRRSISLRSFREDYRWQQENGTFTGDSRALSSRDWSLINNNYIAPRKEEVLNELYKRIYPQVLNQIRNAVNW